MENTEPEEDPPDISPETVQLLQRLFAVFRKFAEDASYVRHETSQEFLQWSSCYFRRLAYEEMQPELEGKIKYPQCTLERILAAPVLKFLRKKMMKGTEYVTLDEMKKKWTGVYLNAEKFDKIARMAPLDEKFKWTNILDLAARSIASDMAQTMKIICEIYSDKPHGKYPIIKFETWWEHYIYLAQVANIDEGTVQIARRFLKRLVYRKSNLIGPKDFLRKDCQPLE